MKTKQYIFFGLGQTGNNIVDCLTHYPKLISDPSKQAYYINFSANDLASSLKGKTLLIDVGGTGKSPEKGERFVEENKDKLKEFLEKNFNKVDADTEFVVITSLGGGTGASLTPPVLDFLSYYSSINTTLVAIKSSSKEGATTAPNMLKTFDKIYNNYVLTNKVKSCLIFDNSLYEKNYDINTNNLNAINTHICFELSKILDDSFASESSEGFTSLDHNEKKKVQFFGKGLADFSYQQLNVGEDFKISSSIFSGKYDKTSVKACYCLVKFKKKVKDVHKDLTNYADILIETVKKNYKGVYIVWGYNFDNPEVSKDLEIQIFTNGNNLPNKALVKDFKKASENVQKINKKNDSFSLDLSDLNF